MFTASRDFVSLNTSGGRMIESTGTLGTILERYNLRHTDLENVSLFDFVCQYHASKNARGEMPKKRSKEAVVMIKPFFKREKNIEEFSRQKLISEIPWRGNCELLKGDHPSWELALNAASVKNRDKLLADIDLDTIDPEDKEILNNETVINVPVLVPGENQEEWMAVAGEQVEEIADDHIDFPEFANFDWSASAENYDLRDVEKFVSNCKTDAFEDEICTEVNYSDLNTEQMSAFAKLKNHFDGKSGQEALLMIIQGTAGTGKSFVIHCFQKLLGNACLVLAPSGVAAFNVGGQTIHSALCIPIAAFQDLPAGDRLEELQDKFKNIRYIIIDEMSMVGCTILGQIDSRLRQIFASNCHTVFGGCSIVLMGDFGQLPPILDKCLYSVSKDKSKNPLSDKGRLAYLQFKTAVFLTSVVRQAGDNIFRDILLRLRNGDVQMADYQILMKRRAMIGNLKEFEDATRLMTKQDAVKSYNIERLKNLGAPVAAIKAVNKGKGSHRADVDTAGGLQSVIYLAVGCKVLLTQNLWIEKGLVNGCKGIVKAICYQGVSRPPQLPDAVMVEFPHYTGPTIAGACFIKHTSPTSYKCSPQLVCFLFHKNINLH
jgi:ATP-dependent DNA helicase PIF1